MFKISAVLVKELRERTGVGVLDCKKALIEANGDIELAIDNMRKLGQAKAAKKACCVATEGVVMTEVSTDGKFGALLELNCETDFVAKDVSFITFGKKVLKYIISNNISNINELKVKFEEQRTAMITKIGENINIRRVEILKGKKIGCYSHGTRIGVLVSVEGTDDDELIKYIAMHITASKPEYITSTNVPANVIAHEYQIQLDIAMQSGKSHKIAEKIITGRMNKFVNNISLTGQPFIMDPGKTVGSLLKEKNMKVIHFIRFEVGEGIKKVETNSISSVKGIK